MTTMLIQIECIDIRDKRKRIERFQSKFKIIFEYVNINNLAN